jgi:hypothetical protein
MTWLRDEEARLRTPGSSQELDHAECVPNPSQDAALAQVGALSSWVCKTAGPAWHPAGVTDVGRAELGASGPCIGASRIT